MRAPDKMPLTMPRHSGADRRSEPGIHSPCLSLSARPWLWIPDSRGACHRAARSADPLTASGMTWRGFANMPDNFVYQSQAVRVLFGRGTVQSVPDELALHQKSRALILCTTSSRDTAERIQDDAADRVVDIHQLAKTGDARQRLA